MPKLVKAGILVPLFTFLSGFLTFMLMSIQLDALWFDSPYDFPFFAIPSIFLGDALILPIFNYRFCKQITQAHNLGLINLKDWSLLLWACIALVLAIVVNVLTHLVWISDPYTGFMDTTLGELSVAGWWHLYFSIVQMFILILYVGVSLLCLRHRASDCFNYAYNTWKLMVVFAFLSVGDFLIRHLVIFESKDLSDISIIDFPAITILFSLAILATGSYFKRSLEKHDPTQLFKANSSDA